MMTITQGYRYAQQAKPNLDYPYLSIEDIDEHTIESYSKPSNQ